MKKTNDVSKIVGVSRRTLQYYDDEGLLSTKRSAQNYRIYDQEALNKIWEILIYKEMQFKLNDIKQLLVIPDNKRGNYFKRQKEVIEKQIIELKVQMELISYVQRFGMPEKPKKESKKTYVSRVIELKDQLQQQVRKGER